MLAFKTRMLFVSLMIWLSPAFVLGTPINIDSILNESNKLLHENPKEALRKAHFILSSKDSIDDKLTRTKALFIYARASSFLGDFDVAIEALYEAERLCPIDEPLILAQVYMEISDLYCRLKDYRKAFEYNDEALAVFKVHQDSISIASCHNNRGIIHANLNEFQTAEQCFKNALAINKKLGNIKGVAANLNNLCLYKGDTEEKLAMIDESIIINKNLNANWGLCENYNNKGRQLFFAGRYKEALKVLLYIKEEIAKIGSKELECDNYEYLSWVYNAMGNYKEAHDALEKLFVLSQELQNDQKLRSVERNISNKRLTESKREMESKEQKLQIALLRRNIAILLFCLLLLTFVAIFIPRWYKKRKDLELMTANLNLEKFERELAELKVQQQKQDLNSAHEHLERVNKEATTFALFIKSRNELLSSIQQMVKDGYKLSGDKVRNHLKQINIYIQQSLAGDQTDSMLMESIEDRNIEYLNRLLKKHPDLTPGDKKLALLLRVDLSTKDIALLLGSNPKSVNMSRYRLRKSLNLDNGDNLIDYLQSI